MHYGPPAEAVIGTTRKTFPARLTLVAATCLAEFAALVALGVATHGLSTNPAPLFFALIVASIFAVLAGLAGLYSLRALRAPRRYWLRMALCWAGAIAAAIGTAFALRMENLPSPAWFGAWSVGALPCLGLIRALAAAVASALSRRGRLDRYAVIVGGGPPAAELLEALARQPGRRLRILGLFDDRGDERSPDVVVGYPKVGTTDDLPAFARHVRVDQIIFSFPLNAEHRVRDILDKLWGLPADFRLAVHDAGRAGERRQRFLKMRPRRSRLFLTLSD